MELTDEGYRWKQLMANLQRGDEIVISKFSNAARGLRELAAFIELCRIKIVRVISIHDSFRENEKPEWLTMEQIKEYSNAMEVTQE